MPVIEETYKRVFGRELSRRDTDRMNFLETVVQDVVEIDGEKYSIEDALTNREVAITNAECDEAQLKKLAHELKKYNAMCAMRDWYLQSGTVMPDKAKREIVPQLAEAGLDYVNDTLDDCMKVLYQYRMKAIKNKFDLELKKGSDDIRKTAQETIKQAPDLKDYVITKMAEYVTHGKYRQPA